MNLHIKQTKYENSYKEGKRVEELFIQHFHQIFGHSCFESTQAMNIHKHIDCYCFTKKSEMFTFDIKGLKKINRKDKEITEDYHWIEIQNVLGKPGWIYGEADYIVFELLEKWLFIERPKLIQLVNEVKIDSFTYPPEPYKLYTRKKFGRDDICMLIPTKELLKIGISKPKPKTNE